MSLLIIASSPALTFVLCMFLFVVVGFVLGRIDWKKKIIMAFIRQWAGGDAVVSTDGSLVLQVHTRSVQNPITIVVPVGFKK